MEGYPLVKDAPGRASVYPEGPGGMMPVSHWAFTACLLHTLGCVKQSQGVWTRVGLELLSQAGLSHLASGWKRRLALCQGWHHPIGKFNKSPWSGARSAQAELPLADFCSWTLSMPQLSILCVIQDWGWVTALSSPTCASAEAMEHLHSGSRPIFNSNQNTLPLGRWMKSRRA